MIGSDKMIGFDKESEFEKALIRELQKNGWEKEVLHHPTEDDLIDNWAHILFENNKGIDRLNECELVPEEMEQLINQIKDLKTPLALNGFINGKTVAITRKNPKDTLHYNKEQHFTTFTPPRKLMKLVYTRPELSPLDFLRFGP